MTVRKEPARARTAPGRFLFMVALALAALLPGGACAVVGRAPVEAGPAPLREPVVQPGGASAGEEARAASLFNAAEDARRAGRPGEAAEIAGAVVDRYPASGVSGRALRLRAETALEAERWDIAAASAARYDALLPPGDPRSGPMRLLGARALVGRGDPAPALEVLLTLDPASPVDVLGPALETARRAAAAADTAALIAALDRSPGRHPVAVVVRVGLAAGLQAAGQDERARALAQSVVESGARGEELRMAREVLAGERAPRVRTVRIASVLPRSGSPALQEFARLIAEGVEVAAVSAGEDLIVDVDARDDHGSVEETLAAVRELSASNVLGAVGFLEDHTLEASGQARVGPLPLVSPTARTPSTAGGGAYSLAGADPEAARAMARYAAAQGYVRVGVIHSRAPESSQEADAFEAELSGLGVSMVGRFAYDAGTTFYQEQLQRVREALRMREIRALNLGPEDTLRVEELPPVALFLPVPPEDVETLAPQVTFFGLDTLGIDVLGTAAWTDPQVLQTVDRRHTDRVVATSPVGAGPGSQGYQRFRRAYEGHFRRTLVSSVPALGYDATLLLLEAIRRGADTPAAVRDAMDGIRGLEGATGIFTVERGRVVRRSEVVRIMNRSLIPTG